MTEENAEEVENHDVWGPTGYEKFGKNMNRLFHATAYINKKKKGSKNVIPSSLQENYFFYIIINFK